MPILNYTTTIAATKTVGEIQAKLAKAGAKRVMVEYTNQEPRPKGTRLVFELHEQPYMLPCRVEAVHNKLWRDDKVPARFSTREQALRVAWRILKDWVEAQLAIIETDMVDVEEVFMPYQVVRAGTTMYQAMREERAERLLEAKS